MKNFNVEKAQGHWVLASLGKKVLRPGGRELTMQMLESLDINSNDDVVEFAPGLGHTAKVTCSHLPKSYTAVEINKEAAQVVRKNINPVYPGIKIVLGNAANTTLPNEYATKVYGEAMLTMQSPSRKAKIICEAARILKKGGLYGIHEVGLTPDEISDEKKNEIYTDLSDSIMTVVRPCTSKEWQKLLQDNGFEVVKVFQNKMHLLEKKRMIADEGFCNFLKIMLRILFKPKARKRVMKMRATFRKHSEHINAISIVARKI